MPAAAGVPGRASVLGFDCAGRGCSAAILIGDRVVAERALPMERGQAAALLPMIEAVLTDAGLRIAALDLLAVTIGPGGFTGLRIGLAAARGLSLAAARPLAGVTSFAAVAAAVPEQLRAGRRLVVALDSKRNEIFLQCFADDGSAAGAAALVGPDELASWLSPGPLILAGDAALRLADGLRGRDVVLAPGDGLPRAGDVARLGAAAWRSGAPLPRAEPLYLRAPDTSVPSVNGGTALRRRP